MIFRRAWSLPSPLFFGRHAAHAGGKKKVVINQDAVERGLATADPTLGLVRTPTSRRCDTTGGDPMLDEASRVPGGRICEVQGKRFDFEAYFLPLDREHPVTIGGFDPMMFEAKLPVVAMPVFEAPADSAQQALDAASPSPAHESSLAQQTSTTLMAQVARDEAALEVVTFEDTVAPVLPRSPPSSSFVSTTRGSHATLSLHLPTDLTTPVRPNISRFASDICRPRSPGEVGTRVPIRRSACTPSVPSIRRSERLAKKSCHRASKPVLQAQNVLMKKLGITSRSGPPDAAAFQRYLEVFTSMATTSQCEAMDELLVAGGPALAQTVSEIEP
jgi:hypothetical protein